MYVTIGMEINNGIVEAILCTEQKIRFKNGSIPIVHLKQESSIGGVSPFVA